METVSLYAYVPAEGCCPERLGFRFAFSASFVGDAIQLTEAQVVVIDDLFATECTHDFALFRSGNGCGSKSGTILLLSLDVWRRMSLRRYP
jgi:hypothetical protein